MFVQLHDNLDVNVAWDLPVFSVFLGVLLRKKKKNDILF